MHEARVRFLKSFGYTELDLEGAGLIMSDVVIIFKKEIFYGDEIRVSVAATDFTRAGFDLVYKLEKGTNPEMTLLAIAKTGMVCYDYSLKKVTALPEAVKERLAS
jgi:acyl-CoA thioesterase FadM